MIIISICRYSPGKIDLGNNLYLFQSKLGWVCGGEQEQEKVETRTEVVSEQNLQVWE